MQKVAVIGTVGVPANYGGFETLVENLLDYRRNPDIAYRVYCSSKAYSEKIRCYKGAELKYLPLKANGWQAMVYDSLSLLHACFTADRLLVLGCSCPIVRLIRLVCRKKLIVNVDGIESAREKWGGAAKKVLRFCMNEAVRAADVCVADNVAIREYVADRYGKNSVVIEYGGDNAVAVRDDERLKSEYGLERGGYCFKVARIEPENNIGMVLEAFAMLPRERLVVVGNWNRSEYGRALRRRYASYPNIGMMDPIYEPSEINLLRANCRLYIHGHSAGGTNPSLVEAMSLGLPVCAFDVKYNRATTEGKALYFGSAAELAEQVGRLTPEMLSAIAREMAGIAVRRYRWTTICEKYERLFR